MDQQHYYRFGEFTLDLKQNVLLSQNGPVPLTPKAIHLLTVLISDHGQIVEKERIMHEVWADSYVEDSNLTFTVRKLRQALGDDAHNPTYIETVARRGYRFIAPVIEDTQDKEAHLAGHAQASERLSVESSKRRSVWFMATASLSVLAVIGLIIAGFWYFQSRTAYAAPLLAAPFDLQMLSTNGRVHMIAISPDGKAVVYTNEDDGKQSVWLRRLDTGNNVQIIPPSAESYFGLVFAPDGVQIYFTRTSEGRGTKIGIYRISIFGGIPTKVTSDTHSLISLSAKGDRLSFVRCPRDQTEGCSIWIADADGANERKILSVASPLRIAANQLSNDGRDIAYAAGQSDNAANEFGVYEVNIETGITRELTPERFFDVKSLVRLADRQGLLITASRVPNRNFGIWHVSLPDGACVPLTKDSNSYYRLSLDQSGSVLAATKFQPDFRLDLFSADTGEQIRSLGNGESAVFVPNGPVIATSSMSGNHELWTIDSDGSRRQLTNDVADDFRPIATANGERIYFASNRSGEMHVWRVNADGSEQTQVTRQNGGMPVAVSIDGNWLYFHHGRNRNLWKISTETGEEQLVIDKASTRFVVSEDKSFAAYIDVRNSSEKMIVIEPLTRSEKTPLRLSYGGGDVRLTALAWHPDGKAVAYILLDLNTLKYSMWKQPLDGSRPVLIATFGREEIPELTFSPDGTAFVLVRGTWKHDAVLIKGLR